MKLRFLFSIALSGCVFAAAAQEKELVSSKDNSSGIYQYVEQMPSAGYDMGKYLSENLKYPEEARKAGIGGRVIAKFVVNEDGSVSDVIIQKGIGGGCDEEAKRVLDKMPSWKPGKQNGKPVRVLFTLPIVFKMEENADAPTDKKAYQYVEQMPRPKYDINEYLAKNIRYPKKAAKDRVEGRVTVKFIINEDGTPSDFTIERGIGSGCDGSPVNKMASR